MTSEGHTRPHAKANSHQLHDPVRAELNEHDHAETPNVEEQHLSGMKKKNSKFFCFYNIVLTIHI